MEFRLTYEGELPANGSLKDKQRLRRAFHPQLQILWNQLPLKEIRNSGTPLGAPVGPEVSMKTLAFNCPPFNFLPLVSRELNLIAELDVLFLRPQEPGSLLRHGGDIDNRIKTLLDSLRMPSSPAEFPSGDMPGPEEDPLYCLLEDDALVTKVGISTDRWLKPTGLREVFMVIHVRIRGVRVTWHNIGIIG